MEESQLDRSLNIGSQIRLSEGCVKNITIGSIKQIREVRQLMKDTNYKFSFSIGRDKWLSEDGSKEIDWPAVELTYKKAFSMVLVGGLTEEEYENVDLEGVKELDELLERFL